jgi:hypothetical protein
VNEFIQFASSKTISLIKRKCKSPCALTEHHDVKAYWGIGGRAPRILDLGNGWGEWSVSRPGRFTPRDRRLGGPQHSFTYADFIIRSKVMSRYTHACNLNFIRLYKNLSNMQLPSHFSTVIYLGAVSVSELPTALHNIMIFRDREQSNMKFCSPSRLHRDDVSCTP